MPSIEALLALNIEQIYYRPADPDRVTGLTNIYSTPVETAGIFRGQLRDWALRPPCYRKLKESDVVKIPSSLHDFAQIKHLRQFRDFEKMALKQIPEFPREIVERMAIAQHFGIDTPLLDWSKNIFGALFFAIRKIFADRHFHKTLKVYLYHVRDERLFDHQPNLDQDLTNLSESHFVETPRLTKRIERQFGVFTLHPHPAKAPRKIPVDVYVLEWPILNKLRQMMIGMGFTDDHFFPDYAGISEAVKLEKAF